MLIEIEDYRQRRSNREAPPTGSYGPLCTQALHTLAALNTHASPAQTVRIPWPAVAAPETDALGLLYAEATLA